MGFFFFAFLISSSDILEKYFLFKSVGHSDNVFL